MGTTTSGEPCRPLGEQALIDVVAAKGDAAVLADRHRVGGIAVVVTEITVHFENSLFDLPIGIYGGRYRHCG